MDLSRLSKLSQGTKVLFGAGIVFFIVSFFNWQEVSLANVVTVGASMWHGWGVFAGILLLVVLGLELLRVMGLLAGAGPLSPTILVGLTSALLILVTLLKVLVDNEFRTFWAWIGLVLSIAVAAGAWLSMQAAGESLDDLKSSVSSAASTAAAAARSARSEPSGEAPAAPESRVPEAGTATEDRQPPTPEGPS